VLPIRLSVNEARLRPARVGRSEFLMTDEKSSFTERLIAAEHTRDRSFPNQRPKPAATLIILDHAGKEPTVLMGRRNPAHKFMPDKFVFPGGRLDPVDRRMSVASPLPGAVEQRLLAHLPNRGAVTARALALAAIRETFEETGLVLGTKTAHGNAKIPEGVWRDYAAHGFAPDLSRLAFVAHAITPPRRPRRFDTFFFVADAEAIAHRAAEVVSPQAEFVELVWIPLAEARRLDLPTVTGVILDELDARVKAGFGHHLPVPFYREIRGRFRREER
jgi:8-oxo-dGTP pyrophosphatase MutT (NUDIX family)